MNPDELARVQRMTRDEIVAEQAVLAEIIMSDEVTDEDLDLADALSDRIGELDAADAAAQARNDRLANARASVQVMRRAVRTDAAVRPPTNDLMDAWDNFLRTGTPNADIAELRDAGVPGIRGAMGEGTGSAGGYTVPEEMANRMTERLVAFGGLIQAAEVITTSSGNTISWPDLDDTANEGEIVAENAAAAAGADLAFTKHELGAYRFDSVGTGGNPLRVSRELLDDSMFDIQGMIERALPTRIMRHASGKFVTGTGANEPQGIVDGLTGVEPADDTTTPTYADLLTWIHSVDPAYRALGNCSWAFNDTSWKTILGMVDTNGDPLWKSMMVGGVELGTGGGTPNLMGYPVYIDQGFVDFDVDDNTDNWGVFGDLREGFVIRMVGSPALLVDPYTRISQNEIQFVANQRMDSIQNNTGAYIAMTGETP